ncbi:MAG TPA: GNAT family N-acetyltransferase [Mycobacterium sp.]
MSDTVIAGDRITLRAPLLHDAEPLFAALTSDPEVTRYLSWPPHRNVEETRGVITGLFNVGVDHTWLIALRDSGELVGQIGYLGTEAHEVQVGYALGRQCWGRGLAGEALRLLVDHLRANPALYRAAAYVHPDNHRSARVLERAGFTLEGRPARAIMFPSLSAEPQDALLYGMALR